MRINKKLVSRLVESEYDRTDNKYHEYVDARYVPAALGLTVIVLIVSIPLLTAVYDFEKWLVRKPGPPPKVITRVIREDALTAAQHEFIQQCEGNMHDNGAGSTNHAIPDIHTNVWTCTFAK